MFVDDDRGRPRPRRVRSNNSRTARTFQSVVVEYYKHSTSTWLMGQHAGSVRTQRVTGPNP